MLLVGLEQLAEVVGTGSPLAPLSSAALPLAPCPPLHRLTPWQGAQVVLCGPNPGDATQDAAGETPLPRKSP